MAIFAKRHYKAVAEKIREGFEYDEPDIRSLVARMLANRFEQDNPNFDRKRFLKACGYTEE